MCNMYVYKNLVWFMYLTSSIHIEMVYSIISYVGIRYDTYTYIYIYIYTDACACLYLSPISLSLFLSLSLSHSLSMYICIHIYIYITIRQSHVARALACIVTS